MQNEEVVFDGDSFFQDRNDIQYLIIPDNREEGNNRFEDGAREEGVSRIQRTAIIIFSIANIFVGVVYSVTFSYYPTSAIDNHNIKNETIGLILGVYELALVIGSAFFGKFLGHIGVRFVFISSLLVLGLTSILFGFVDDIKSRAAYTSICIITRTIAGLAGSGVNIASLAFTATVFPQTVTKMMGVLELCSGLGIMLGPVIGGALHYLGEHFFPKDAFLLPLAVCGVLLITIGVSSVFLLPSPPAAERGMELGSLRIALIPSVMVVGLVIIMGGGAISYINATLANELDKVYGLKNSLIRSLVFVVGPLMYAMTAPIWGNLADKHPRSSAFVLILGYLLAGLALWLTGPAPWFNIKHMLWLLICSQIPLGLGIGTVVTTFKLITVAAIERGHPGGFGTAAVVSGLFGSYFSMGAFLGPWLGGKLKDHYGFGWASFHFGCAIMVTALLLLIFTLTTNVMRARAERERDRKLIINYK